MKDTTVEAILQDMGIAKIPFNKPPGKRAKLGKLKMLKPKEKVTADQP